MSKEDEVIFRDFAEFVGMKSILLSAIASSLLVSCSFDRLVSIDTIDPDVIQGITFATEKGKIFLPLGEVEVFIKKELEWKKRRTLTDGTLLITLVDLEKAGSKVLRDVSGQSAEVSQGKHHLRVVVGAKSAEVDLSKQRLRGWQGDRLVLNSRVSSGRRGRTPTGKFSAGPYKARRHYSSLYNNAPMPYSVQVNGNVFIHGFTSVPDYPASHGCIRVPLDEGNPAKFFYEWVSIGTPIEVR